MSKHRYYAREWQGYYKPIVAQGDDLETVKEEAVRNRRDPYAELVVTDDQGAVVATLRHKYWEHYDPKEMIWP